MNSLLSFEFDKLLKPENLRIALNVAIIAIVGFLGLKILIALIDRLSRKRVSDQSRMILRKAIFYVGVIIIFVAVLKQLGLKLAAVLGAAGIAGIAIGFASQTSVSNIISGLFLISEKPFTVGDIIRVGETTGIILSIDLLSVKIRTFDNQYVRIPNETLIKTEVTNITKFPIRRHDIDLKVSYREDLNKVREALFEVANSNPYCLDNPEPLFIIKNFGNYGIEVLFGVWFSKDDYLAMKNSIMKDIKRRFEKENIEMAYIKLGAIPQPIALTPS